MLMPSPLRENTHINAKSRAHAELPGVYNRAAGSGLLHTHAHTHTHGRMWSDRAADMEPPDLQAINARQRFEFHDVFLFLVLRKQLALCFLVLAIKVDDALIAPTFA